MFVLFSIWVEWPVKIISLILISVSQVLQAKGEGLWNHLAIGKQNVQPEPWGFSGERLGGQCSLVLVWFSRASGVKSFQSLNGPRQANLVLIAYASSEGSGEPAHPRSLARTFAARSYKQWVKRNLQTESQIPGPSEWLGMRSQNLSWRNARRHKFAWRGPIKTDTWRLLCDRQVNRDYS